MSKKQILILKLFVFFSFFITIFFSIFMFLDKSNTIVIATKNITEQRVVASVLKEVIERDTDYDVEIKNGLDATSFLHYAILKNDIDIYIEYSSTAFLEIFKQKYEGQDSNYIVDYIKKEYNKQFNLQWISSLGFDNSNAIICKNFCIDNDIKKYSDLKNKNFSFGAPPYFYDRSDGFNLLEDTYGFSNNVDKKKMDLLAIAVAVDSNKIDTGLAFTTDAKLALDKYVVLEDDLNSFPKYDAGIIVSDYALNKYDGLEEILKSFEGVFNNKIIQRANQEVENGQTFYEGQKVNNISIDECKKDNKCEIKDVSAEDVAKQIVKDLKL